MTSPSNIEELQRRLSEAFFRKDRMKVTALPRVDDQSGQREASEERTFALRIVSIDRIPDGLQAHVQDTETLEWAVLTITDTAAATILVVE